MLKRNNLIVLAILALWLYEFGVFDKLVDRVVSDESVAVVALVTDNDGPDLDGDADEDEVTKTLKILRETHDIVVVIDESPESVESIEQGSTIVDEAERLGGKAIVLIGESGDVIRSVAMPATSEDQVRWVNGD